MKRYFCFWLTVLFFFLAYTPAASSQDFDIRGRLHMDAFIGLQDTDAFHNGFNNRRARIGVNGTLADNWDGRIEVDFSGGGISPNDFRLRRSFSDGSRLWIGQYKVPMGLNELTSSNNITFIERASNSNMIADSRRMGVAYERFGSQAGFKTMIFGRAVGQRGDVVGDMPVGIALRGVFAPQLGEGTLHLGGSVVYEDLMDNITVGFSDRPEARDTKGGQALIGLTISDPDLQDTFKGGLELAYINGPVSLEGEFLMTRVGMDNGDSPVFQGWHIQSSYVLTGEGRSYSTGGFGGVSPSNNSGAWEIAARFSHMDLNDSGYIGGRQSNLTLGLNHYITSNLRFMGNIIIVNLSDTSDESVADDSPIITAFRAQYHF